MNKEFMKRALFLAKKAESRGEVPVGAVIVKDNKIIGEGYNKRESEKNALCHAEIIAINNACKTLGDWRLENCEMYVTLEPCFMCAGAIFSSRISTLIFGSYDLKYGCIDSKTRVFDVYDSKCEVFGGILEDECNELINNFFKAVRKNGK